MSVLIDINVAIHLRDLEASVLRRLSDAGEQLSMSILTVIELEGGVSQEPGRAEARRIGLRRLLKAADVIECDLSVATVYGDIIQRLGFSRSRLIDRLIAATSIVHDLTLITINGPDFRDIPGLALDVWPAPGQ